jgi:uncharacterized membrane protein
VKLPVWLGLTLVAALLGLAFAGLSTYDFVQHLDRQVHDLHCSFIPGLGKQTGESGCHLAMMSPYSSVFRTHVWGGVPIALPAMAVFAFIAFATIDLVLTRRKHDVRATGFLALATALPLVTSIAMLVISLTKLGTTCKLCVGIYLASAAAFTGAVATWRRARRGDAGDRTIARPKRTGAHRGDPAWASASDLPQPKPKATLVAIDERPPASWGFLAALFAAGVAFTLIPVLLYLAVAPDHARFVGTCGALVRSEPSSVMLALGTGSGTTAVEVLDPLCPACRAFEQRLAASGLESRIARKAVLFPLDNTCNWMVTEATHPGACTVSEAMLCAPRPQEVLDWAFAEQERIRTETQADPTAAARLVKERFPQLSTCLGSPEVKARLNKSLRWAVSNNVRVLTPQLFVEGVKLCDEDVDLGLEYMLTVMLDRAAAKTLTAVSPEQP